jgi:hypothetical protein
VPGKLLLHAGEIGVCRNLERELAASRLSSLPQLDRELADLGRKKRPPGLACRERQPGHLGIVVDGLIEIGRLERRMADA